MEKEKLYLFGIIAMMVLLFAGYWFYALPKQEKIECEKWIRESSIYPNYYFTEWQKEQCLRYGYDIDNKICK
jgi:Tfp pilus assembly protein PilO